MLVEKDFISLLGVTLRPNPIAEPHRSNDVDTTLRLSSFTPEKKTGVDKFSPASTSNPMPLHCFHEGIGFLSFEEFCRLDDYSHRIGQDHRNKGVDIPGTSHVSNPVSDHKESSQTKNKKRKSVGSCSKDEVNKSTKKSKLIISPEEERVPSLDDIPGLVKVIMSENGTTTMPVFLYKKRLEASDVSKGLNWLMINEHVKLMEFLTEDEIRDMSKLGLNFSGIDSTGRAYELRLKNWPSLKTVLVMNHKGWSKLISQNNVKKGDWVRLWGYRRSGKFCLAIEFKKAEAVGESGSSNVDVASTSTKEAEAGSSGIGVASSKEAEVESEAGSSGVDVAVVEAA